MECDFMNFVMCEVEFMECVMWMVCDCVVVMLVGWVCVVG